MASNMPTKSNPVQDLGQKQLHDLEKDLKRVRQQRKCITKKRQDAQNEMIELERKLVIYGAKNDNALAMTENSRVEMQQLRGAILDRCRTTSDLDHQLRRLQQEAGGFDGYSDGLGRQAGDEQEELKRKIAEIKEQLVAIVQFQTSSSESLTQFSEELESATEKKRELTVKLQLLKNNQEYGQKTMDKELQEKLRLEQKLHQLNIKEQNLEEENQHLQQLTKRQQMNLCELINNNSQLTKDGRNLSQEYNAVKNTTNKIIRELQCAKHDEANLQESAMEVNVRVSSLRTQLDQEIDKRNCLLRKLKEKETVQGDEMFASSCESSMSDLSLRSPSTRTTSLDNSRSHTESTSVNSQFPSQADDRTSKLTSGSSVSSYDSVGRSTSDDDSTSVQVGSSELASSVNTASYDDCL